MRVDYQGGYGAVRQKNLNSYFRERIANPGSFLNFYNRQGNLTNKDKKAPKKDSIGGLKDPLENNNFDDGEYDLYD